MVRLKELRLLIMIHELKFQFHYGTIKSLLHGIRGLIVRYFNSTMVRLKACEKPVYAPLLIAFQFHYGTIKRVTDFFIRILR